MAQFGYQLLPAGHVTFSIAELQHIEHLAAEPLLLHRQRHRVDAVGVQGLDHGSLRHAAEATDLAA